MELQTLGVQALVVAMMVALGLDLSTADIVEGLRHRRAVAALVVVNVVVIPVLAWVFIEFAGFSTGLTVDLLLTAVSPGGPTGPLFTRMARGDVGFGVGVMILLGAVGLVSAPLSMTLLLDRSGGGALLWPMLQTLLLFQVAPLCAAMAVRRVVPKLAATVSRPATLIANGLLLAVIVGLLATRGHLLFSSGLALHAFAVGFVLVSAGAAMLGADA
ncbi:MAG: bile acid:sodium symporter, partial [Nannocystaceae bacterium]|nr:bile acid:sodium symporter [Nannocystaceae bacterium]